VSDGSITFDTADLKPGHTNVGFFGSVMNLLNALVGAGILGVPSTFDGPGMTTCIILATLITAISYVATSMTLALQEVTASDGIDDIAHKLLGRWGLYSLSISILVFNVSALVAFVIIGTDFILSWLRLLDVDASGLWPRAGIVFVYGLAIPIALSIPKSLKFLSYVSGTAMFCCVVFVIATIADFFRREPPLVSPTIVVASFDVSIFSGLAVYSLAFSLPACICPVICDYHENLHKRKISALVALIAALVLTILPSIFSYLQFGAETKGNVLDTYPDDDPLIIAVRAFFFVSVTLSWPSTHPAVAASWSALVYGVNNPLDLVGLRRGVILFLGNSIPLVIAMFLKEVKPALEVGGAIGGCIGNFMLPALMWFVHSEQPKTHWSNVLALALVVFGAVVGVISTYFAIQDAIAAFSE
jgi:amino acid permease